MKRYADLGEVITEALGRFAEDVRSGAFPEEQHTYAMPGGGARRLRGREEGLEKPGLAADLDERRERPLEVHRLERGRHLHADARRPLRARPGSRSR